MDRLLKKAWNFVAQGSSPSLHVRLYRLVCLATASLCLAVVLPVNLLQHLHPLVNVGDVLLGLFAWYCYRASCRGRNHVLLFFVVLVLLMDPAWFLNGGSQGSITYYFFAAALYPLALCRGKTRWLLAGLLMVNMSALLVLEHAFPGLVVPFRRPEDRLIDLVTGVVCSCLMLSLFAWVIIANYDWEQKLLSRYARELAASEQKYREVVENARSLILRVDPRGRITFFNKFAEALFGHKREEVIGRPLVGSILPVSTGAGEPPGAIVPNATEPPDSQLECEALARDGRPVQVSWTRQPIYDENHHLQEVLWVGADITERLHAEERRRQSEQQLQHIQRLESLGILAGGIAHDFNNLLTAILGNISLTKSAFSPGADEHDLLWEAEKACGQARDLTAQLLTFSRGGKPVRTAVALKAIVSDSTSLALCGSSITCRLGFPEDLWPVDADAAQLAQVFNNLIINAHQAMPNGGQIVIEALNRTLHPADQSLLPAGRHVQVKVRDEGAGIAAEHLPRIFDPYFTTKKTGSGLGLAVAYSVLKNHHGTITVESRVGAGTTFTLLLPASAEAVAAKRTPLEAPRTRSCRILVMDDDKAVRTLLGRMLTRQGHTVECVGDGAAAVALYQQAATQSQPFDLVIMDLTVPGGMGGREAIQRLRETHPQVKAIVSSGYSDSHVMADHQASGFQGVMPKPYDADQLRAVIQAVLNS